MIGKKDKWLKILNIFQLKQIRRCRAHPENLSLVLLSNEYLVSLIFQHLFSVLSKDKKASSKSLKKHWLEWKKPSNKK